MKIERPDAPGWLAESWEQWGREYAARLEANPAHRFTWRQIEGEKVNQKLLPLLKSMTASHCSFCDKFSMGGGDVKETIEHFRPKSRFPHLAYQWGNLFLACHYCQEKREAFHELLLKPDEVEYEFSRYFVFNFRTFKIEPRRDSGISAADQRRAEITLSLYKLNYPGREQAREREHWQYQNDPNPVIDDYSYRYLFL